ncbi:lysylphosphatidylglycerol synthase transmembrane domain-containing protein [Streptomyces anandii]|uniref:lysylphosphatidylglycerol synthase transmembrane domain-containing protein n=1 Tax=Streptomyces anandii TaxID=285454 RepID=UPI00167A5A97|nr:lysylphosphatidylglycerol synthase domain-containing protein [Streptomyces anandii]GGX73954.1 membrane protein [Streptomyces anandii JCM 4720]
MTTTLPTVTTAPRRRVWWHTGAMLALLVCAAYAAHRHWPVLETGADRLAVADQGWLLLGATAAVATWACSALAQQGAVAEPLPGARLVAAQFAASAANHVLPAGLGAGAVNLRFLMRCGLPAGRSASALAVKATAGVTARAFLIAVLAGLCPGLLRVPRVSVAALAAVLAAAGVLALVVAGPLRSRCARALATVAADIRAVHARPNRAAALWGGSLAFAAAHSLVLIAVTQAVELPLSPARVALLYLAASSAAALLPTPGGLGSLDAALAFALTTSGSPAATAASAVLGYRLLTVWLPLLPGLLVLGVLIRRRAV